MSMSEHGPYQGLANSQIAMARPYCSQWAGSHCGSSFHLQKHLPPTPTHPQEGEGEFPLWKMGMGLREVRVLGYLLNLKGVCAGWGMGSRYGPSPNLPPGLAQLDVMALLPAGP